MVDSDMSAEASIQESRTWARMAAVVERGGEERTGSW